MVVKFAIASILAVAPVTLASFTWTVGDQAQSCDEVCGGSCTSVPITVVTDFQAMLANIFPVNSVPCDGTQAGDILYDPSISDHYCGWSTDAGQAHFSCTAKPPIDTARFCPCGTSSAGSLAAGDAVTEQERADNLKKVNKPEWERWSGRTTAAPTLAETYLPAVIAPAPAAPVMSTGRPGAVDSSLEGEGHDYYNIINIASGRALYALSLGLMDSTSDKIGASVGWEGSIEQNWRVEKSETRDGVPLFTIANDANERLLFAYSGDEGTDGQTGFGATASILPSGDEALWYLDTTTGDNSDTGFQIRNVQSNRLLFADSGVTDLAGVGAISNVDTALAGESAGDAEQNTNWKIRVQSRTLVDGSTVHLFHHSFLGGTDATTEYCIVSGDAVHCDGSGRADEKALFQINFVNVATGSFSVKSVTLNKYCTAGPTITCDAVTAGPAETFTVEKKSGGAVALKSGVNNCVPSTSGIACSSNLITEYDLFEVRCVEDCASINEVVQQFDLGAMTLDTKKTKAGVGVTPYIGGVVLFATVSALVYRRQGRGGPVTDTEGIELLVE